MNPEGRSAIVTGGAGGLGAATVDRLVALGMTVVVLDRAAPAAGDVDGDRVVAVTGDINDDADVGTAIDLARARGTLSVLVNVAGGAVGGGRLVGDGGRPHDMAAFRRSIEVNLFGTFNVARLVTAAMADNEPDAEGERGVVVNTASIAGIEGQSGQLAYGAAKAAILGMTLPMARDLAPLGIRVCAIAPGPMGTPALLQVMDQLPEDPTTGIVFPPRLGRPDEFAQLVESVVRNRYLNGENIRLDGALRLGFDTRSEPDERR